ncbi:hypothetical protein CRP01_29765 [Flavilitoribacter nigricans DSM 23189 = NBRC 102662]|uniref:Uncharacterized protein n=2 Tax=Flavilitoribacter TaxID=2762562 RepID=A0A2D0N5E3_FLAN2|nr:hypothetical protein CRP01_29765 [Flavilitoribacter nigricans DSM 23189 = NBRC 102662]
MQMSKILTLVICSLLVVNANAQSSEDDYVELIQRQLGGEMEVAVTSGFVDLLTDEYAYEVEFSNKWKQAIGQALWYGLQTNKKPGIILIKKTINENKYGIQLETALDYGGLRDKIKVLVWPDDFKVIVPPDPEPAVPLGKKYWLTISTQTRHNSGCRYFQDSQGQFCAKNEGTACKRCGG